MFLIHPMICTRFSSLSLSYPPRPLTFQRVALRLPAALWRGVFRSCRAASGPGRGARVDGRRALGGVLCGAVRGADGPPDLDWAAPDDRCRHGRGLGCVFSTNNSANDGMNKLIVIHSFSLNATNFRVE